MVLCQGMGSVAAATICGCTTLLAMLAYLTHTRTFHCTPSCHPERFTRPQAPLPVMPEQSALL